MSDDVLKQVNKILLRSHFSHHPNCSNYDKHVINIGLYRFCLGCTATYSFIILFFFLDLFFSFSTVPFDRFYLGLVFFLPTLVQVRYQTRIKLVKFTFRASLGVSIYFLISSLYFVEWWLEILGVIIFAFVVYFISFSQEGNRLIECVNCSYDQEFNTCVIRYSDLLEIKNLSILRLEHPEVQNLYHLLGQKDRAELIELGIIGLE